ncbi:MAG: oligoendopeptidase, partial [Thermoplasmata archaeon]|nr:oligoendopeptidase [Thermoplasmata archaeon]
MSTSLAMAETASIMGEMILFHSLLDKEDDPKLRLSLLCGKIEDIFATSFRQVMMTRFEKRMHAHRRDKGELKAEDFHTIWKEENEWMFGDSVIMTEDYSKWWTYVLHFIHYPFYTYAYAFGELMVLSLYEEYRRTGDEFVGKYLELLSSGGSDYPKDMVAKLGLDITDPGFWQRGFDLVDEMVKQAEELAKEVGY